MKRIVGLLVTAVLSLSLSSLVLSAQDDDTEMENEIESPLIQAVVDTFNEQDLSTLGDFLAEDFTFSIHGNPSQFGVDATGYATWVTVVTTLIPDWHLTIETEIAEDDLVATRWSVTGTHTGEIVFPDGRVLTPTGNAIALEGTIFIQIEDERIAELWVYFNELTFDRLTGQLPSLPEDES